MALSSRLQLLRCDFQLERYQDVLAHIKVALDEATAVHEVHKKQQIQLLHAQTLVYTGNPTLAHDTLMQLKSDMETHHTINTMEYVHVLHWLSQSARTQEQSETAKKHVEAAERAINRLLEHYGWIGTRPSSNQRLNRFMPFVDVYVHIKLTHAQILVEQQEPQELKFIFQSIDQGLQALEHTVARLDAFEAQLLLLKGALLRKQYVKTPSNDQFQATVAALERAIQVSMQYGGYDRILMRQALLELVDLDGQPTDHQNLDQALHHLQLACAVNHQQTTLLDSLELQLTMTAPLPIEKLDLSIQQTIQTIDQHQSKKPETPLVSPPSKKPTQPATSASSSAVDSLSVTLVNYFVRLQREQELLGRIGGRGYADRLLQLHTFLVQHHPSYAKLCCFSNPHQLPSRDAAPTPGLGFIAIQWRRDAVPAVYDQSTHAVTMYFALGTVKFETKQAVPKSEKSRFDARKQRFTSSPVIHQRQQINPDQLRTFRLQLSQLRVELEDEQSLVIDRTQFEKRFRAILLRLQQWFRPTDGPVKPSDHVRDAFGLTIPNLSCTLEIVTQLEQCLTIHKGFRTDANASSNALCYLLRDLLD